MLAELAVAKTVNRKSALEQWRDTLRGAVLNNPQSILKLVAAHAYMFHYARREHETAHMVAHFYDITPQIERRLGRSAAWLEQIEQERRLSSKLPSAKLQEFDNIAFGACVFYFVQTEYTMVRSISETYMMQQGRIHRAAFLASSLLRTLSTEDGRLANAMADDILIKSGIGIRNMANGAIDVSFVCHEA